MKEKISVKKVQLPFVMKPNWTSELTVLFCLGLGLFVGADLVYFAIKDPTIAGVLMCALFVVM